MPFCGCRTRCVWLRTTTPLYICRLRYLRTFTLDACHPVIFCYTFTVVTHLRLRLRYAFGYCRYACVPGYRTTHCRFAAFTGYAVYYALQFCYTVTHMRLRGLRLHTFFTALRLHLQLRFYTRYTFWVLTAVTATTHVCSPFSTLRCSLVVTRFFTVVPFGSCLCLPGLLRLPVTHGSLRIAAFAHAVYLWLWLPLRTRLHTRLPTTHTLFYGCYRLQFTRLPLRSYRTPLGSIYTVLCYRLPGSHTIVYATHWLPHHILPFPVALRARYAVRTFYTAVLYLPPPVPRYCSCCLHYIFPHAVLTGSFYHTVCTTFVTGYAYVHLLPHRVVPPYVPGLVWLLPRAGCAVTVYLSRLHDCRLYFTTVTRHTRTPLLRFLYCLPHYAGLFMRFYGA